MLEQTVKNGPVYMTLIKEDKLHQKRPTISEISFGPRRPITCYQEPDGILVINETNKDGYLYQNNKLVDQGQHLTPTTNGSFYYYGIADYQGVEHTYFIQNQPRITLDKVPDINTFTLPSSMTGFPYEQTFSYDPVLNDLIGDCPATYVDRYKRPLNIAFMKDNRYFPIGIDKVSTKFRDLSDTIRHYPVVVQLANTEYGVLDLEPGYTTKHLTKALGTPHLYVEDTPRGGKHFLVRVDTEAFKYRWSDKLELITGTMVTFYGINSKVENINAKPMDVSEYSEVGKNDYSVTVEMPKDVDNFVERLTKRNKELESSGLLLAQSIILDDPDRSHGDYMALRAIYYQDIEPFIDDLPSESLGWILATYGQQVIPWRMKHDEYRKQVPYLVSVAHAVIDYANQGGQA